MSDPESWRTAISTLPSFPPRTTLAAAKLNLTLRVLGRRTDGYHELESIVAFADVGDVVGLSTRAASATDHAPARLMVAGEFAEAIVGENLVERALRVVEQAVGGPLPLDVTLDKRLPVAAGIGGGSADAAGVLRLLAGTSPEIARIITRNGIAASLGADVPVCLESRPALMTGVGERVQRLSLPSLDIVLANAQAPVPADKTRRVFQALAAGSINQTVPRPPMPSSIDRATLLDLMRRIGNDLEAPATRVMPELAIVKAAVAASADCKIAALSGAGPTIFGIYPSAAAARSAEAALRDAHPTWWVRACATVAS